MPDDPMMVFFDAKSVAPLLRAAARATAYDMNSSLEWKDEQTSVVANMGDKLLYGLFHCGHPISAIDGMLKREYVRGNAEVDINYNKVEIDTETNFNLFSANFARFAAQSPAQAVRYLDEKKMQIDRAYANMTYKFESARKIQSQVQQVLANAVDNTYRIKVAADVGMAVGLAFTPVWFAIPGGIFYVLATETAKTRIDIDLALGGLIGKTVRKKEVQENLAYTTLYAAEQGYAEKLEKDADKVMEEAEKQAHRVEEKALEKIRQVTEKAAGTLNREARKQVARQAEKILAEKEAVQIAKNTGALTGAAAKGFQFGGIAVALYFLKDDIYKAWHGYNATEREELLKQATAGAHASEK